MVRIKHGWNEEQKGITWGLVKETLALLVPSMSPSTFTNAYDAVLERRYEDRRNKLRYNKKKLTQEDKEMRQLTKAIRILKKYEHILEKMED